MSDNLELNCQFAYDQGWMSANSGETYDNPYPDETPEAQSYKEGFDEGSQ